MVGRYGAFRRTLRTSSCGLLPRKRSRPDRVTAEQLKKPELQHWLRKTKGNVLDYSLLQVAEFRHAPAEVAPLHGIRAKAQCSLVGGQRFFIPLEPA